MYAGPVGELIQKRMVSFTVMRFVSGEKMISLSALSAQETN